MQLGDVTTNLHQHLRARTSVAPLRVGHAMLSLLGVGADVRASFTQRHDEEERTTWRCVWLTADRVAYTELSAPVAAWHLDYPLNDPDRSTGWMTSRSDVRSIRLDSLPKRTGAWERSTDWYAVVSVLFVQGDTLTLPFWPTDDVGDITAAEAIVGALRGNLPVWGRDAHARGRPQ